MENQALRTRAVEIIAEESGMGYRPMTECKKNKEIIESLVSSKIESVSKEIDFEMRSAWQGNTCFIIVYVKDGVPSYPIEGKHYEECVKALEGEGLTR